MNARLTTIVLAMCLAGCAHQRAERAAALEADRDAAEQVTLEDARAIAACVDAYAAKNYRFSEPADIAEAAKSACSGPRDKFAADEAVFLRLNVRQSTRAKKDTPLTLQIAREQTRDSIRDMDKTISARALERVLALRAKQ